MLNRFPDITLSEHLCEICYGKSKTIINYNNHKNLINLFFLKQVLKYIFFLFISIFLKAYKSKNLFSPFSKIILCKNCGYGKLKNTLCEEDLRQYYSNIFWNPQMDLYFKNETKDSKNRADGQFSLISKYLKKIEKMKILEIGAGSALVGKKFLMHNNNVQLDVVETGENWTSYYEKEGIKRIAHFYPDDHIKKYDLIITSHWLEHIIDLKLILNSLYNNLNTHGILFVEVPNCDSLYWQNDIKDTPHLHFFTKNSLETLFSNDQFEVLFIDNFGLTNGEFYNQNFKNSIFNNETKIEIENSIIKNIHRKHGNVIRLIARKT